MLFPLTPLCSHSSFYSCWKFFWPGVFPIVKPRLFNTPTPMSLPGKSYKKAPASRQRRHWLFPSGKALLLKSHLLRMSCQLDHSLGKLKEAYRSLTRNLSSPIKLLAVPYSYLGACSIIHANWSILTEVCTQLPLSNICITQWWKLALTDAGAHFVPQAVVSCLLLNLFSF